MKNIFIVCFAIIFGVLLSEFWETKNDKLFIMRNDILNSYYDAQKLEHMMKDQLGEEYIGDLESDFDNFVVSLVLEKISEEEIDKNKRYNAFMSETEMKSFVESREESAQHLVGRKLNDETYYIDIDNFVTGITFDKFNSLVPEISQHPHIIIDLRNNSGGYFDDFVNISDLFLDKDTVIYETTRRDENNTVYAKDGQTIKPDQIIILANDRTASVSELFILALKENLDNVTVIGTPTYGKNISYAIRKFKDGSGMRFITSIMGGPHSTSISDTGIEPDILSGRDRHYYELIDDEELERKERDADEALQLKKSLEFLGY